MKAIEKFRSSMAAKNSHLCVGLDTVLEKIPEHLKINGIDGMLEFNREIINATKPFAAAYKVNLAFYEQYGTDGYDLLKKTFELIPADCLSIADAKRGDIGNTSKAYAKAVFEELNADAITVNPYMGNDSVAPFLYNPEKFVFLLAFTSNPGSFDFQKLKIGGKELYKCVVEKSVTWASKDNLGFVVGATHPSEIADLREMIPDRLLLIPGIGTQGGDIPGTVAANGSSPFIINVSRDIIYQSQEVNFALAAGRRAEEYSELFRR